MEKLTRREIDLIVIIFAVLILLTLSTNFFGKTDISDYTNPAKFFAGDFDAKIRTSHSYFFGFIHTPFVDLFNSFLIFKITSLIFLFLLIYSVYFISKKNKKALWLMLLSPVVWYLAPWVSPIQLSSLLFLWAYYFIGKYDKNNNIKHLFYSGVLIGLSWAFWDTILFFGILLGISFLYNKKIFHGFYFILFILFVYLPRLVLDQAIF